jgi:membrane-associated phospholipid phosphatase
LTRREPLLAAASLVATAAFLALAGLVAAGSLTSLDQHAVDHWMPWLRPHPHGSTALGFVVPPTKWTVGGTVVDLWTYPAAVVPSALLVLAASTALRSYAWLLAWVAGNVVELIGKAAVARPALYVGGVHVNNLGHSFPSGHALRAVVVAAALAAARPRLAVPAFAWTLLVPVALVVLGDHTPTDVAGGLLIGLALVAATLRLRRP